MGMKAPQVVNNEPLATLLMGANKQEIALGSVGQEKFCRLVAAGHTYETAYKQAYNPDSRFDVMPAAYRLMRAPHIVARVMQIRAEGLKGYVVDRPMLLENLLWAVKTARERGSTDQVQKAIMNIGKLFGLVIEKVEADVLHKFQIMKEVTVEGDTLVFDVGSNTPFTIKGEPVDGSVPPVRSEGLATLTTPPETAENLASGDEASPISTLQNAFKTLPAQPIEVDTSALPLEASLDVGGVEAEAQHVGKRGKASSTARPANGKARREVYSPPRRRADWEDASAAVESEDAPYCGEDML